MDYQFNAHGVELGQRYRSSAIRSHESFPEFQRDGELYFQPDTVPGSHLPHVWVQHDGKQLSTLADAYDVKLPRELVLIGKQFLYVERYMKLLAPSWQMMSDPQLTGYFANFMVEVSREHQSDVEV